MQFLFKIFKCFVKNIFKSVTNQSNNNNPIIIIRTDYCMDYSFFTIAVSASSSGPSVTLQN